jgi:hypothetical protein
MRLLLRATAGDCDFNTTVLSTTFFALVVSNRLGFTHAFNEQFVLGHAFVS